MKWFRRPSRAWRKSSSGIFRLQHTGRTAPAPRPAPKPRTLIEVLGIGRTIEVSGVPLTLLSYERYREGDVVTFSLRSRRGLRFDVASPEIFIRVGPSAATVTPRFAGAGGGGGGDGQELHWRHSFEFGPPMPDDATDWVVEVTKIEWARHRAGERDVDKIDTGPWRFVIRPTR